MQPTHSGAHKAAPTARVRIGANLVGAQPVGLASVQGEEAVAADVVSDNKENLVWFALCSLFVSHSHQPQTARPVRCLCVRSALPTFWAPNESDEFVCVLRRSKAAVAIMTACWPVRRDQFGSTLLIEFTLFPVVATTICRFLRSLSLDDKHSS